MNYYQKTTLGLDALQQRHIPLNARQRRLLVLIGTEDFEQLADQFKQRIATPEILEQLIDLGLIHSTKTVPVFSHEYTQLGPESVSPPPEDTPSTINTNHSKTDDIASLASVPALTPTQPLEVYSFEETRELMMSLLQRYCGLLARQLVLQIQSAADLHSLKRCQMQWITALQESRIEPILLNHHLQQINQSLLHLQAA